MAQTYDNPSDDQSNDQNDYNDLPSVGGRPDKPNSGAEPGVGGASRLSQEAKRKEIQTAAKALDTRILAIYDAMESQTTLSTDFFKELATELKTMLRLLNSPYYPISDVPKRTDFTRRVYSLFSILDIGKFHNQEVYSIDTLITVQECLLSAIQMAASLSTTGRSMESLSIATMHALLPGHISRVNIIEEALPDTQRDQALERELQSMLQAIDVLRILPRSLNLRQQLVTRRNALDSVHHEMEAHIFVSYVQALAEHCMEERSRETFNELAYQLVTSWSTPDMAQLTHYVLTDTLQPLLRNAFARTTLTARLRESEDIRRRSTHVTDADQIVALLEEINNLYGTHSTQE